ncbi:MAG TPA: hypothetical protein VGG34_12880 [Opitutaceae bacterium]|jgi:hypothetical protein
MINTQIIHRCRAFVACSALLLSGPAATAYISLSGGVLQSDGSASDTQAAINAAPAGGTVQIPPGTFTWSSGVTVSGKAVKIRGAGGGRVVGMSASQVSIALGAQEFTTSAGGLPISNGQILTIYRTGGIVSNGNASGIGSMTGIVTSYSGTSLSLNVTASLGSSTQSVWIIATQPHTTLVNDTTGNTTSGALFELNEATNGSVDLSGLCFTGGTGTADDVVLNYTSGGSPVLVHDCLFLSTTNVDCIFSDTNRGVIWNCSFAALPFSEAQLAVHMKGCPASSWTSPSTMGTADTSGTNNLYIEDCDFHGWLNATDMDDCSRSVVRHCLFNNAGFGTHGADTSTYGVRHFEIYDNTFVFNGFTNGQTLNLNWWCYLRGGTGVITGNVMPHISSQDYGSKADINMTVMNLQRNAGPNPCWGAGHGATGNSYPAPRQVGMGYVNGNAGNDSVTYKGDSEPLYIWNNTGGYQVGTTDYGGTQCSNPDATADYIISGRDYFNNNTPKPGYQEYTYPHPLRPGQTGILPTQPGTLNATSP